MKKIYFLFLFPLIYYYGCTGGCSTSCSADCWDLICGKYYYTIYDSLDSKLVEGVINISDCVGNTIGGTYSKDKIYNDTFSGYASLKGFFNGNVDTKEKKANINLNPKISDNNIYINIDIKKESLTGKWTYSTMKGRFGSGKFLAVKIK